MNKKIKERAIKILHWIEIETEINQDTKTIIKMPKEYELKTIDDVRTIREVERLQQQKWKASPISLLFYKKIYENFFKGEEKCVEEYQQEQAEKPLQEQQ